MRLEKTFLKFCYKKKKQFGNFLVNLMSGTPACGLRAHCVHVLHKVFHRQCGKNRSPVLVVGTRVASQQAVYCVDNDNDALGPRIILLTVDLSAIGRIAQAAGNLGRRSVQQHPDPAARVSIAPLVETQGVASGLRAAQPPVTVVSSHRPCATPPPATSAGQSSSSRTQAPGSSNSEVSLHAHPVNSSARRLRPQRDPKEDLKRHARLSGRTAGRRRCAARQTVRRTPSGWSAAFPETLGSYQSDLRHCARWLPVRRIEPVASPPRPVAGLSRGHCRCQA